MHKNTLTRQVRRAYRKNELARICTMREDRFGRAFGMQTVRVAPQWKLRAGSGQPEDYYHYRDNGASVLAVAHLDTVVPGNRRAPHFADTPSGPRITSGALDDRLGAYVILSLLPELGITCDWLLTVGEESGQSTAGYFSPDKKYDWAIEFDRGGTDVVMYQYEDYDSVLAVEAAGAEVGSGSFSDISCLEHLGIKAFNWGVGYRGNYHSEAGYAYLNDTFTMVARYLRFHEQNAGTVMPHDPERDSFSSYRDDSADCAFCGARNAVDGITWYCRECTSCADCGMTGEDGCMCYTPAHIRAALSPALSLDEPA